MRLEAGDFWSYYKWRGSSTPGWRWPPRLGVAIVLGALSRLRPSPLTSAGTEMAARWFILQRLALPTVSSAAARSPIGAAVSQQAASARQVITVGELHQPPRPTSSPAACFISPGGTGCSAPKDLSRKTISGQPLWPGVNPLPDRNRAYRRAYCIEIRDRIADGATHSGQIDTCCAPADQHSAGS